MERPVEPDRHARAGAGATVRGRAAGLTQGDAKLRKFPVIMSRLNSAHDES